eukprot:TRINITY_DN6601_c0_g1_i1.p1 TRINITY_DN6601_c0_g1~~TRINITY_DN6601_c0_g1_i1.p1  ORF type:complete len:156 (+),score=28.97 TRINITY_DN6601_c0_g1_i1:130-597(+)
MWKRRHCDPFYLSQDERREQFFQRNRLRQRMNDTESFSDESYSDTESIEYRYSNSDGSLSSLESSSESGDARRKELFMCLRKERNCEKKVSDVSLMSGESVAYVSQNDGMSMRVVKKKRYSLKKKLRNLNRYYKSLEEKFAHKGGPNYKQVSTKF